MAITNNRVVMSDETYAKKRTQPTVEDVTDDKSKKNAAASNTGSGGYVAVQSAAPSTPARNYDTTVPSVFGDTRDPELTAQYESAMAALEQMKGKAPVYGSQYDAQIQDLYQQIMGRGPFKYDQKTDPLYQQYVQDYTTQGKMAMRDTMGQAAALTGGYGSSYGQAVGQQQYDQYLQRMADILPQTYGMALDAYNAEGNRLTQNLGITTDLEKSDYDRYLDALNQHNIDLNRAQAEADTWYGRMTDAEKLAYNRQMDQYELQKDQYARLMGLMAAGYTPSLQDYHAAGLSEAQGEALRSQYAPAEAPSVVYVGGGSTRSGGNNVLGGGATAKDKQSADAASGAGVSTAQYNGIMQTIRSAPSASAAYSQLVNSSVYGQLNDQQRTAVANALARK